MSDSTFSNSDFKNLHQAEESLGKILSEESSKSEQMKPSVQCVQNILAYSKALSIRKSAKVDFIENILN